MNEQEQQMTREDIEVYLEWGRRCNEASGGICTDNCIGCSGNMRYISYQKFIKEHFQNCHSSNRQQDTERQVIKDFIKEFIDEINAIRDPSKKEISLDTLAGVIYDLKTMHGITHEDDIGGSYTIYLRQNKPAKKE